MSAGMDVRTCGICGGVAEEQCGDPCVAPGSLWFGLENRCTYEVLDEPSKFGDDMVLAVILTSARKARGRYGACPLKGDRVYLRREDFGVRLQPVEQVAG